MPFLREILAFCLLIAGPAAVLAQPPGFEPLRRPNRPSSVSPYLGLIGGNNSVGFNYYEIYRPQRQARQEFNRLNREVNSIRSTQALRSLQTERPEYEEYQLGPTGHPTMFMNTRGYFPGSAQ